MEDTKKLDRESAAGSNTYQTTKSKDNPSQPRDEAGSVPEAPTLREDSDEPKFIGQVSVDITNKHQHFVWENYGLQLEVRENSLPTDIEKCTLHISACLSSPFEPPKGHELVSAAYSIRWEPEVVFVHDLTLEIEHCEDSELPNNLVFVQATNSSKHTSRVNIVKNGTFPEEECYGYLQTKQFGWFAIFQINNLDNSEILDDPSYLPTFAPLGRAGGPAYPGSISMKEETSYRDLPCSDDSTLAFDQKDKEQLKDKLYGASFDSLSDNKSGLAPSSTPPKQIRRYCAILFKKVHSARKVDIEIVICRNLQTHIKAVKREYVDANGFTVGPRLSLKFDDQIALEVEDVSEEAGAQKHWKITFLIPPVLDRETVDHWSDTYGSSGVIPAFQFTADFDQDVAPVCGLSRKLILNGVSGAFNWLRLAVSKRELEKSVVARDCNVSVSGKPEKVFFSSKYWKLDRVAKKFNGKKVMVAVLDSGVNPSHIALENSWSTKRILYCRNFIEGESLKKFDDTDPRCHGTGVASIIAGKYLNPKRKVLSQVNDTFTGFSDTLPLGVAPESSLVICRISTTHPYPGAVAGALQWIYEHNCLVMGSKGQDEKFSFHKSECELDHSMDIANKICIVNMSIRLGLDKNNEQDKIVIDKLEMLIRMLKDQCVICVAGAGNDGNNFDPGYPALFDNVLSVGAVDCFGAVANFSTKDSKVIDVYALGENVLAAKNSIVAEGDTYVDDSSASISIPLPPPPLSTVNTNKAVVDKGGFQRVSGTSFATPAVSGLIAILVQCARDQGGDELVNRLTDFDTLLKLLHKHMLYKINDCDNIWLLRPQFVEKFFNEDVNNVKYVLDELNK